VRPSDTGSPVPDGASPAVRRSAMAELPSHPAEEHFGEASLGDAQSSNPPDDPDMLYPDAEPLDTAVEDADLFLGLDDDEPPR
jgi:hypothetical protein